MTATIFEGVDADKLTQQKARELRDRYGPPDITPLTFHFRKPQSGDIVEDTMNALDDLSRQGRALSLANVPIYGGPDGGMTAAAAYREGLMQSVQMCVTAASVAMLPMAAMGAVTGLSTAAALGGPSRLAASLAWRSGVATLSAWWGVESESMTNPNMTVKDKLTAGGMGALMGFAMPISLMPHPT